MCQLRTNRHAKRIYAQMEADTEGSAVNEQPMSSLCCTITTRAPALFQHTSACDSVSPWWCGPPPAWSEPAPCRPACSILGRRRVRSVWLHPPPQPHRAPSDTGHGLRTTHPLITDHVQVQRPTSPAASHAGLWQPFGQTLCVAWSHVISHLLNVS